MLTDSSPFMGVTEAAKLLGVDRSTVTRLIQKGKLIAVDRLTNASNGPYLLTRVSVTYLAAQRKGNQ